MRKRIFEIIEVAADDDRASKVYDLSMIVIIVMSLVPLVFKQVHPVLELISYFAALIFIADYILRWATADYKLKKGRKSFAVYPFTFMAIVDLLSILPSFVYINASFRALRILRMFVAFRVFKAFRYSDTINIIRNVINKQKKALFAVIMLTFSYVLTSALIVFNIEPDTFENFFDALYWATISLATIGYGDIAPVTMAGRAITMISTVVGVAVIALPSGIITAGYMSELNRETERRNAELILANHGAAQDDADSGETGE